jgi:hypothetical protein
MSITAPARAEATVKLRGVAPGLSELVWVVLLDRIPIPPQAGPRESDLVDWGMQYRGQTEKCFAIIILFSPKPPSFYSCKADRQSFFML